jgi:hypothetical protein
MTLKLKRMHKEQEVKQIVSRVVDEWALDFRSRHIAEHQDSEGTINMKIHNVFIKALGPELQYYTALVRSLDSSLGNMLEQMAIEIAKLNYEVSQEVAGPLGEIQTSEIAKLLESYKSRQNRVPKEADYQFLRSGTPGGATTKRHDSDYYLRDRETGISYLIELKIGGDLDNKKARSEKEALLEQFAILSNKVNDRSRKILIRFATAYNRFGEDKPWLQGRVRQFFADEELLIGKDFWNFVCKSDKGYQLVTSCYEKKADVIRDALDAIRKKYIG